MNALRWSKVTTLLEMIKFSHTVFALPFALTGAVLASLANGRPPTLGQVFWICVAMAGARTVAMGLNRIIDARIDAENPRTAQRHLPAGRVSYPEAWLLVGVALGSFLLAAWMLNPLCFVLSPVALGFLVLYSYCKRFTSLAHVVLGICLGAAPLGAWIALRGSIGWPAVILAMAVMLWVAGFDIFYSLQDVEFDRQYGLYSFPVTLGVAGAIQLTRALHVGMMVLLFSLLFTPGLDWIYLAGLLVVCGLLIYEHLLVRPGDLSKLDAAFFNMNGYISITIFLSTLADGII